jgi:tetratricopeptide (TPR) repeat protein
MKRTSVATMLARVKRCARGHACDVARHCLRLLSLVCLLAWVQPSSAVAVTKAGDSSEAVDAVRRDIEAQLQSYEKRLSAADASKERIELKRQLEDMRADVASAAIGVSSQWLLATLLTMLLAFVVAATWFLREARRRYFQTADALKLIVDELRPASEQGKRDVKTIAKILEDAVALVRSPDALPPVHAKADLRDDDDQVDSSATVKAAALVTHSALATQAQKNYALGVTKFLENQFAQAATLFAAVVVETPHDSQALNHWGVALGRLSEATQGDARARLMQEASSKFADAVKHKPDNHDALYNWGVTLGRLANEAHGEEQKRLWQEAIAKYAKSVKHAPAKPEALLNWGLALSQLANAAQGDEQKRLRQQAIAKFGAAVEHEPDMHEALFSWGVTLVQLAEVAQGDEQRRLMREAIAKYAEAVKHKPDKHEAHYSWGVALYQRAKAAQGDEQVRLLQEAIAKYAEAVKHKPDKHEAHYNWGVALSQLARVAHCEDRKRLLQETIKKYAEAVKHKPDKHEALNNWGNALSMLANESEGEEQKRLRQDAIARYSETVKYRSDAHEALYNWGIALGRQAAEEVGERRKYLLQEAIAKYAEALKHKPDKHEALLNWGGSLLALSVLAESKDAKVALLDQAEEKVLLAKRMLGHSSYLLACVAAQRGDARRFAAEADDVPTQDWPDQDYLRQNIVDLEPILDDLAFREWWLRKYGSKY